MQVRGVRQMEIMRCGQRNGHTSIKQTKVETRIEEQRFRAGRHICTDHPFKNTTDKRLHIPLSVTQIPASVKGLGEPSWSEPHLTGVYFLGTDLLGFHQMRPAGSYPYLLRSVPQTQGNEGALED